MRRSVSGCKEGMVDVLYRLQGGDLEARDLCQRPECAGVLGLNPYTCIAIKRRRISVLLGGCTRMNDRWCQVPI